MNGEYLKEFVGTIAYLLPLLALVWKGAKMASKIDLIENVMKEKVEKFCSDHKELQKQIENERKETDRDISAVLKSLSEIQRSIVRIETTLNIGNKEGLQ